MPIPSTELSRDERNARAAKLEPLVVNPTAACLALGCDRERLYQLLNRGALETYLDGRARRITTRLIRAYIERQLQAAGRGKISDARLQRAAEALRAKRARAKAARASPHVS
jgi:hypothetical protein